MQSTKRGVHSDRDLLVETIGGHIDSCENADDAVRRSDIGGCIRNGLRKSLITIKNGCIIMSTYVDGER